MIKVPEHYDNSQASAYESGYIAALKDAAKLVEDKTAWCGGHGEPRCPSGTELAEAILRLENGQ